jgi:sensor domain CHASE-containing protein
MEMIAATCSLSSDGVTAFSTAVLAVMAVFTWITTVVLWRRDHQKVVELTKKLEVRLPAELLSQVREVAERSGLTTKEFIEKALKAKARGE